MSTRRRHAQIHLPPMTGEQAHAVATALERALVAVWRTHRDELEEIQARPFRDPQPGRTIRPPSDADVDDAEIF